MLQKEIETREIEEKMPPSKELHNGIFIERFGFDIVKDSKIYISGRFKGKIYISHYKKNKGFRCSVENIYLIW